MHLHHNLLVLLVLHLEEEVAGLKLVVFFPRQGHLGLEPVHVEIACRLGNRPQVAPSARLVMAAKKLKAEALEVVPDPTKRGRHPDLHLGGDDEPAKAVSGDLPQLVRSVVSVEVASSSVARAAIVPVAIAAHC